MIMIGIITAQVCGYPLEVDITDILIIQEADAINMAATAVAPATAAYPTRAAIGKSAMCGSMSPAIGNLYGIGVETVSAYGNQDTIQASPRKYGCPIQEIAGMVPIVIKNADRKSVV